jgi:photosystem II stability/assembly factor-like uncharacterized protein
MKKKATAFLFILTFCIAPTFAQNFWQKVNGPYTFPGDVQCLAGDSNGILYAGVQDGIAYQNGKNGIFQSTDNGETWKNIALPVTPIYSFVIDSKNDVYAGATYGDMWYSTDTGNSWTHTHIGVNSDIRSIIIALNGNIVAATFGAGIQVSRDSAKTWNPADNGLTNIYINALAVATDGSIYAGADAGFYSGIAYNGGVFQSTDNGTTWFPIDSGIPSYTYVYTVALNKGGDIFIGTNNGGVYRSTNHGRTWDSVNNGIATNALVRKISIDSKDNIFAGTNVGIFRSTDNGQSWQQITNQIENTTSMVNALLITSLDKIFVAIRGSGVFRSLDDGDNWTQNNSTEVDVSSMACDKTGNIFVGSTVNGLFRSSDHGLDWMITNGGINTSSINSLAVDSMGVIYITTDMGVFRTTNNGLHWDDDNLPIALSVISIGPGNTVCAGGISGGYAVLYSTTDGGSNWTRIYEDNFWMNSSGIRGVSMNSIGSIFILSDSGFFRSTDMGNTWRQLLTAAYYRALIIDQGDNIFLGWSNGLIRSTDGGISWQESDSGLVNVPITCFSKQDNDVYAGTMGVGMFKSTDHGIFWQKIDTDGLINLNIQSVMIDSSGYLYVNTDSGLFKSVQIVTSVNKINVNNNILPQLPQNYPNPFSGMTNVEYKIPNEEQVTLEVYNALGEKIATLAHGEQSAGAHSVPFQSNDLQNGIYFYRLTAGKLTQTGKMAVIK